MKFLRPLFIAAAVMLAAVVAARPQAQFPSAANTAVSVPSVVVQCLDANSRATPCVGGAAGTTGHHAVLANSTNATVLKTSGGSVMEVHAGGTSASAPAFLKFYDKATSPTCNSDAVVLTIVIPANSQGAGNNATFPVGRTFTSGIAYCVTGGIADTDNTAVSAATWTVNVGYK